MALSKGEAATTDEVPVVPVVPFEACLAKLHAPTSLDNFRGRQGAIKTSKFATFPRFLMLTLQRYYTSDDWQARPRRSPTISHDLPRSPTISY